MPGQLEIIGSQPGQGEATRKIAGTDSATLYLRARAPQAYYQIDVLEDANCPQIGGAYDFNGRQVATLLLSEISAKRVANSLEHWDLTLKYAGPSEGDQGQQSPLLDPPEVSLSSERLSYVTYQDLDKKPFINSAGEKFDHGLQFELIHRILSYSRNQVTMPSYDDWIGAVNSDQFGNKPPGQALCRDIRCTKKYWKNTSYWNVAFEIALSNYDLQYHWELDAGTYWWEEDDEGDLRITYPTDRKGIPSTRQVLLDNEGGRLGDEDQPPDPQDAKGLQFRIRPKKAFSVFNISY